ncbi:MAG TPA: alpha/beta hydrolase family protein [Thermomonospora sp.]|nr:alpha/beta hydrolase family protein [Thermomonospora sp.]
MTISRGLRRGLCLLGALALGAGLVPGVAAASAPASRPADNGARIIAERRVNASTLELTMRSPAVGGHVRALVLTPRGWRRDARTTWPTIYLYGGGGGDDHTTWIRETGLAGVAARWNVLVVLPFAAVDGGYVDHFNYGRRGRPAWETHHTLEIRQLVERNLRAGTRRAVFGVSAGGLGSMAYAGRHPGMFRYVASFSSTLHIRKPGVPQILMALGAAATGKDPYRVWGVPALHDANWKAHDPYELAPRLRGTGLYVSSGTTGEPGPLDPKDLDLRNRLRMRLLGGFSEQVTGDTTRSFVARLRALGIPVTAHLYGNGWHTWAYWDREMRRAWPLAMKAIGAHRVP